MAEKTTKKLDLAEIFKLRFLRHGQETDLECGPLLLRLSSRYDSTGFYLYAGGPVAVGFHCWKRWNSKRARNMRIRGFRLQLSPLLWLGNRWAYRINMRGCGWTRLDRLVFRVLCVAFVIAFRARGGILERHGRLIPGACVQLTSDHNQIPYGFA